MTSISKRNLLGGVILFILLGIRITLYYLNNDHNIVLMNEFWYVILDYLIIASLLIFHFENRGIRIFVWAVIGIMMFGNTVSLVRYKNNNERIVYNSTVKKDDVIIDIDNMSVGSEIYVYEREYGVFAKLKDIMYNEQGNVEFNTRMKVDWIGDRLLSITYQDENQTVEKIINFKSDAKRYGNILASLTGVFKSENGRTIDITKDNIAYEINGFTYNYASSCSDEQNSYATILYGDYAKPSIAIVKKNDKEIYVRRVSLLKTTWTEYDAA